MGMFNHVTKFSNFQPLNFFSTFANSKRGRIFALCLLDTSATESHYRSILICVCLPALGLHLSYATEHV